MARIAGGVLEYGNPAGPAGVGAVSMRQARLALHYAGKLDAVEAAIVALPEPQRTVARIEWNAGGVVERSSPTVALIAAATSMSESDLNALFQAASQL